MAYIHFGKKAECEENNRMSQWKEYQNAIKGCEKWASADTQYLLFSKSCQELSGAAEPPSVEMAQQILEAISRGHALIRAASNWRNPGIGKDPARVVVQCRGQQWRFFQAFSGFEVLTKAVFGYNLIQKGKPFSWYKLQKRIQVTKLFPEDTLPSPMEKKPIPPALHRWQSEPEILNRFLGLNGENTKVLKKWLTDGKALKGPDVLQLAVALRNAIAHGKLSPTKSIQWNICPHYQRLVYVLEEQANIILKGLVTNTTLKKFEV
jgi:hypothetical protein